MKKEKRLRHRIVFICTNLAIILFVWMGISFYRQSQSTEEVNPSKNNMIEEYQFYWQYNISRLEHNLLVEDSEGNDITGTVISLWEKANCIYNVDDIGELSIFDLESEPSRHENGANYYEVYNFDEVVDSIFNENGKRQLLSHQFGGALLFLQDNGKTWRLGPWKGGNAVKGIPDAKTVEVLNDHITLSILYIADDRPGPHHDYDYVFFGITKNQNDEWKVDNYIYPQS